MDKYTLYLDEGYDDNKKTFAIAGFIIKNEDITQLNEMILETKKKLWTNDEYINSHNCILHCTELTTIYNNRKNTELYKYVNREEYKFFKRLDHTEIKKRYNSMYHELCNTVKQLNITVIGCIFDIDAYNYLYGETPKEYKETFYEIAVQEIIENFTHFLIYSNGVGYIVYESQNNSFDVSQNSADIKMHDNFCKIKVANKGISNINNKTITKSIRYLSIEDKCANLSGLQLTDFIVYNIVKAIGRKIPKNNLNEFTKKIYNKVYNGNFSIQDRDLRYYFGIKKLPFDYHTILMLEKENSKIKNSLENIKTEKNNLLKKNQLLTNKNILFIEREKNLKDEINKLKNNKLKSEKNIDIK